MSLNEINRELEVLLQRIKLLKKEEELASVLDRVEELRVQAQDPNNSTIKMNKPQDVRTFESFTAVYKGAKLKADSIRDAGHAENSIDSADSMERRAQSAHDLFCSNIEPKKLALLEEFKDRYSEEELIRVLQENADTHASSIQNNERDIAEKDKFLNMVSKYEVDRYTKNSDVLEAINKMNYARRAIERAQAEIATLTSPADDVEIANQNKIITDNKTKIEEAKKVLVEYEIVEAKQIVDENGNINNAIIQEITNKYKKTAKENKEEALKNFTANLGRYIGNHEDSFQDLRTIESYIGAKPEDFSKFKAKDIDKIIKRLKKTKTTIEKEAIQNQQRRSAIEEIEQTIAKLEKEKSATTENKAVESSTKSKYGFLTPKEYRELGVELDDTYRNKNFWEQRKERQDFILSCYHPDAPFKKLRAWFRSFSPRAGYALSQARIVERQMRRKEETFQEALKRYNNPDPDKIITSVRDARIIAMQEVRTDKLSGKRKAQMEERE